MAQGKASGNTAPGLTAVAALFGTWSLLTYLIRCWVKRSRRDSWGIDDTLISVALAGVIFHVVTVCQAINHGYGNPWRAISPQDRLSIEKSLYASQILYYFAYGMSKISMGFFNVRLTLHTWHTRLTQTLIVLTVIWTIAAVLVVSIRGKLSSPWTISGSKGLWYRWLSIEVAGLALEISLWAASVSGIAVLNISLSKKLSTCAVFSTRLAILPIVALRLYYLSTDVSSDIPVPNVTVSIYTEIAVQAAFMLASVICLKTFLQPFHPAYFITTKTSAFTSTTKDEDAAHVNSYYMLSAKSAGTGAGSYSDHDDRKFFRIKEFASRWKHCPDDIEMNPPRVAKPKPTFSPVESYYRATICAKDASRHNSIPGEGQMGIKVRETWTVTIEERIADELRAAGTYQEDVEVGRQPQDDVRLEDIQLGEFLTEDCTLKDEGSQVSSIIRLYT